jgi:hypothetical protein
LSKNCRQHNRRAGQGYAGPPSRSPAPSRAHAAGAITLGITSATALSIPHYIADEKKYYAAEGLDVPGGRRIRLADSTGEITIKDRNGNSPTLGRSGITIDGASAIEMKAKAKANISIKAGCTDQRAGERRASGQGGRVG